MSTAKHAEYKKYKTLFFFFMLWTINNIISICLYTFDSDDIFETHTQNILWQIFNDCNWKKKKLYLKAFWL